MTKLASRPINLKIQVDFFLDFLTFFPKIFIRIVDSRYELTILALKKCSTFVELCDRPILTRRSYFFVEKEIQACSKTEKVFVTPFDFYWFP